MGTFSVAKAKGWGYHHTAIQSIGANPLDSPHTGDQREPFLQRLNDLIRLPSDDPFPETISLRWRRLTRIRMAALRVASPFLRIARKSVLIRLQLPYPAIDRWPSAYQMASPIIRDRLQLETPDARTFVVDIHVRRAIVPPASTSGVQYERFVPLSFYEAVLEAVAEGASSAGLKLLVNVHTDAPDSAANWVPPDNTPRASIEHWKQLGQVNDDGSIVLQTVSIEGIAKRFNNVRIHRSIDPIAVWNLMVSADLLVTSASSLSYVGGLLRGNAFVVSPRFWHSAPDSWLVLDKWFAQKKAGAARMEIAKYVDRSIQAKLEHAREQRTVSERRQ